MQSKMEINLIKQNFRIIEYCINTKCYTFLKSEENLYAPSTLHT